MGNSDDQKTHTQLSYDTEIGQRAKVHREVVSGKSVGEANRALEAIGEQIKPHELLTYMGSAAVHAYKTSDALGTIFFVSQTGPMQDCPEQIASSALTDLQGTLMQMFGRKRRVKRSGF